jgi:helix-turn-helix protein
MVIREVKPFAAVPIPLIERASSRLDSTGPLLTLIGILSYANREKLVTWPRTATLAKRLGLTPRTVRRHIHKLEAAKVLKIHPHSPTPARSLEILMPGKDVPFGQVPVRVLEVASGFGAMAVCVYAVLSAYTNRRRGTAWPCQATIAVHLNVTARSVRTSLDLLAKVGLISKKGYSLNRTVHWRVRSSIDAISQAAAMLALRRSEAVGTGNHCPHAEAVGTQPGSDRYQKPDNRFRQSYKEDTSKRAALLDDRDEMAVLAWIEDDLGWFHLNPNRTQLAHDAVSELKRQGYGPELLQSLMALAVLENPECLGSRVVEWIRGGLAPELAERAQRQLEEQEEKFGLLPTYSGTVGAAN